MNHLAHFVLAGDNPAYIVGALLGDHVKGPLRGALPGDIETGIRLHRRVDALTDSHPLVAELLTLLPPAQRRYGGIALDVCFDRHLSEHWHSWQDRTLAEYCGQVFKVLREHEEHLPAAAVEQYRRLQRYDVLVNIRQWQTVNRILTGIGQRLRRENPLHNMAGSLEPLAAEIGAAFDELYPALQQQLHDEFTGKVQ